MYNKFSNQAVKAAHEAFVAYLESNNLVFHIGRHLYLQGTLEQRSVFLPMDTLDYLKRKGALSGIGSDESKKIDQLYEYGYLQAANLHRASSGTEEFEDFASAYMWATNRTDPCTFDEEFKFIFHGDNSPYYHLTFCAYHFPRMGYPLFLAVELCNDFQEYTEDYGLPAYWFEYPLAVKHTLWGRRYTARCLSDIARNDYVPEDMSSFLTRN